MAILNLVYQEYSDIDYKITRFPDGQQSLVILDNHLSKLEIEIVSRLNNFLDLELIICATQALKEMGIKEISLTIPYCIGGRSDRKFTCGGINYVKCVIAPILNSQNYINVNILDPHSDVLEACINNFQKIDIVDTLIENVIRDYESYIPHKSFDNTIIISPDAGSLKRIYDICKNIQYKGNVVVANKHRNVETGKIIATNVQIPVHEANKDIFIIDDICDGGRTFIELAKAIKFSRNLSSIVHPNNYGKIYLIVTHGIFSNGLDELKEYFDGIYTTNSVREIEDSFINVTNIFN